MNENEPKYMQPEQEARAEVARLLPPRIYVASLSDYNNAILYGRWIVVSTDAEEVQLAIDEMLAGSPTTSRYGEAAEEWAIHDYDGFADIQVDEYQSLTDLAIFAEGIKLHGEAFTAWVAYVGDCGDGLLGRFEERYRGEWDSIEAYAEDLLDELDAHRTIAAAPEWLQPYLNLDVSGFARDLCIGGDVISIEAPSGRVWVYTA